MTEIKILGISGKKQSGKDTSANYIVGIFLKALKIVKNFNINQNGSLIVTDILGNKEYAGILDLNSRHPEFEDFAEDNIYPFIKTYSYASLLKKHLCIDILGLTYQQCFGTNEDKMSFTNLEWEDMPGVTLDYHDSKLVDGLIFHKAGPMTAREVLQFVGTEIFRKMYGDVWVDATLRQIHKESPSMAIITDTRFVNEIEGITNIKPNTRCVGKIIRLTKDVFKNTEQHESETALDNYSFSDNVNCTTIDNDKMTIDQQNKEIYDFLAKESWLPFEVPSELL